MPIAEDIQKLDPGSRIELFELDLTQISRNSSDRYYFHTGVNQINGDIVWKGQAYTRYPVEATGFEMNAKGSLPRPTLRASNVTGLMTALDAAYDGLVGAKVIRRRTLARYLDAVNFPAQVNYHRYSEQPERHTNNNTATSGPFVGPDGQMNAVKILDLANNSTHFLSFANTGTAVAAGETWTYSVSVKEGDYRYAMVRVFVGGAMTTLSPRVTVDLMDGKVVSSADTTGTPTVTPQGNGWFRVAISLTTQAAGSITTGVMNMVNSTTNTYLGDSSKGLFMSEPQLQKGLVATNYVALGASFSANPYADPNQALPDDIYYIERKIRHDRTMIEYEMASAMDLMGQKLPSRLITTYVCQWEYRRRNAANTAWEYPAYGCPYTGANMFTVDGVATTDPLMDSCSKDLNTGCKLRYPNATDVLPFGGFPGSKAYKF